MTSRAEALDMFRSDDLIAIGREADSMRRRLHPAGVVTYSVEGVLDGSETTSEAVRAIVDQGGTGVVFSGAPANSLQDLKTRFPACTFSLTADPIAPGALARLHSAGLDSILSDDLEAHRAAHALGMKTTATLTFGTGESPESLTDRIEAIRRLQEATGGFTAFVPVMSEQTTAVEYLKTLAISRIYLDAIPNIQGSWAIPGLKICQLTLRFGANDIGCAPVGRIAEEDLRHIIRGAGFVPKQRDALYSTGFLN